MSTHESSGADEIAEAREREHRIVRDLNKQELVTIRGVVSPDGGGASRFTGDDYWTFRFSLEFWRMNGGEVHTRKLQLRKQVGDAERGALFDQLKPNTIVEMQARVLQETELGDAQGLLHDLERSAPPDAELEELSQGLLEPVEFKHPVFGRFVLNRVLDCYVGKIGWGSNSIGLTLDAISEDGLAETVKTAEALWKDPDDWNRKCIEFAARRLVDLKNDAWLGENEEALSRADFVARMSLRDIAVLQGDEFEFLYDDGDMFLGHCIRVTGNLARGLTDAGIQG